MITKGMAARGTVAHIVKGVGTFGQPVSHCGRWVTPGETVARLCKTCIRITGHVELPAPTGDAADMIRGCVSDHRHINPDVFTTRKHSATELAMYRDVLDDYSNGAENDACWIGTLMLVLDRPKLTQEVKTAELNKRQGGNGNGGLVDPNSKSVAKPARKRGCGTSEKQEELIRRVIGEIREINSEVADALDAIYTDEWHNTVEWKRISPAIDSLFIVKRFEDRKARENAPKSDKPKREWITNSVYVIDGVFNRVAVSGSGNPYTVAWIDDEWVYQGQRFLNWCTDESKATAEQAAQWGHEHNRCVFCYRQLNREESRTVGYGPDCADSHGLPYGK